MKRLILSALAVLFAITLNAQNRVFCEIVEMNTSGKKVKVMVDFGQQRKRTKRQLLLVDEEGRNIHFNSKIDALNHMNSLGWQFLQAYTEVHGSDGDTGSTIHWLLYKDVKNDEDPFVGITTKAMHGKADK